MSEAPEIDSAQRDTGSRRCPNCDSQSENRPLRPYHGQLVQAFAEHGTVSAVARVTGVSLPTIWRWLRDPRNKAEVENARRYAHEALSIFQSSLPAAAETLRRVAENGAKTAAEGVTVRAAEAILKGHEALRRSSLLDHRLTRLETKIPTAKVGKR